MNAITPVTSAAGASMALLPQNLTEAMKLAELMSKAKLLPQAVQNPADAFMIVNQALRWGMDPFAVAQEVAVIQGRMMYSGKIVAAALHTSGVLDGRLNYEYEGENGGLSVTVTGRLRGESEPRSVTVTLKDAKTNNAHWVKSPNQMLSYHAARVWARRHAPEVMLGVYAPEEWEAEPERPEPKPVKSTVVPRSKLDPVAAEMNGRINRMTTKDLDDATNGDEPRPVASDDPPWVEDRKPADKITAGVDALLERIRGIASEDELHALVGEPQTEKQRSWLTKHRPELEEAVASALGDRYAALVAATVEEPA
jgi:hypothetical protein